MADQFRKKVVDFIHNSPKITLLIFTLSFALFAPGILKVKENFTYKAWYNDNDPQVKKFQEFEKIFGNDDNILISLSHKDGLINQKSLILIKELTETLWKTTEVVRVDSLTNFQSITSEDNELLIEPLINDSELDNFNQKTRKKVLKRIASEPLLTGYLISEDQKAVVLQAFIRPAIPDPPDHSIITNDIKERLKPFKKKYPEYDIHLFGTVPIVDDFKNATIDDIFTLLPILYACFTIILFFRFRSFITLFYIFSTISTSTLFMLGAAGYLGQTLNTLTSACPTILMTIALSDAVHIFSALFLGLKEGYSLKSSLYYSMIKNFYPTLLTSLTTALGFLSFFNAKVEPVAELGIIVSVGILFAWYVTYFALVPCIQLSEKFFKKMINGDKESVSLESEIVAGSRSKMFTALIYKYRYLILLFTFISGAISIPMIRELEVNMDPYQQFKSTHPSVIAQKFVEKHFTYTSLIELSINSGVEDGAKEPEFLHKVDNFIKELESKDEITKVISINSVLKSLNKYLNSGDDAAYTIPATKGQVAESLLLYSMDLPQGKDLSNFISLNNDKLHLTMQWTLSDSHNSRAMFKVIKKIAKKHGLELLITGKTPLFHELTPYVVSTFLFSIILAFITITLVLMLSLKSFTLGALALIPNIYPLLIGGAVYYLTGLDIDMGSVLVASVCLGIAVDDSIHFLFEYQKYRGKMDQVQSVEKLFTSTFPALTLTTVLLCVGFASFIFGNYIPNIKFGVLCAFIIVVALLADLIILPAVVFVLDRKCK